MIDLPPTPPTPPACFFHLELEMVQPQPPPLEPKKADDCRRLFTQYMLQERSVKETDGLRVFEQLQQQINLLEEGKSEIQTQRNTTHNSLFNIEKKNIRSLSPNECIFFQNTQIKNSRNCLRISLTIATLNFNSLVLRLNKAFTL